MLTNHKKQSQKIDNKICKGWYNLKTKLDMKMNKILNNVFEKTEVCFCCLEDLRYQDIYG